MKWAHKLALTVHGFDTSGISKNDNSPKVLVGHGVRKCGIEITG